MTIYGKKPPEDKDFRRRWESGGIGPGRLAGRALEVRDLVDAVRALPDVRHDKVAALKESIESGTYVVDAVKIAQRMIDEIR